MNRGLISKKIWAENLCLCFISEWVIIKMMAVDKIALDWRIK